MKVILTPSCRYDSKYSISYKVEEDLEFTEGEELTNKRLRFFEYGGNELVDVVQLINDDYEKALEARKGKQLSIKATIDKLSLKFPLLNVESVEWTYKKLKLQLQWVKL